MNTLDFAIEGEKPVVDGKTYERLTLRRMKARDLVAGDLVTGDARRGMAIFASMAGVPIGVIEGLDIDDFERLGAEAAPLMGKSAQAAIRAAGEAASRRDAASGSTR